MKPNYNLWLENEDEEVTLSTWRVKLLKAVSDTGSISAAAEQMKVQYRTAWQKINEMEERLGQKLVETQIGGSHGGGAQLTPEAQEYIKKFDRFNAEIERLVLAKYRDAFGK
jgi:molybdate transport system regulatory protein